jgi:glycosyltransferase involved in cell wall biosynthesis
MSEGVFISVCIPAYNRLAYLKRLLDSIQIQLYRNFEVVISDDSPGGEIYLLVEGHPLHSFIRYFKNSPSLGTPENWNECIRRAKGNWIKLMHDDDWFSDAGALGAFAAAVEKFPDKGFFFCAYRNIYADEGNREEEVRISPVWEKRITVNPETLLSRNVIGPPSVVLHKKIPGLSYDNHLKWLVDIDFYISYLRQIPGPEQIPAMLVNVGIGQDQVTQSCFRNPLVEIPENLYVLDKYGIRCLKHILVYDAFWRFLRNLGIRSLNDIRNAKYHLPVPPVIVSMIRFQSAIPPALLKTGVFSKLLMRLNYISQIPKLARG